MKRPGLLRTGIRALPGQRYVLVWAGQIDTDMLDEGGGKVGDARVRTPAAHRDGGLGRPFRRALHRSRGCPRADSHGTPRQCIIRRAIRLMLEPGQPRQSSTVARLELRRRGLVRHLRVLRHGRVRLNVLGTALLGLDPAATVFGLRDIIRDVRGHRLVFRVRLALQALRRAARLLHDMRELMRDKVIALLSAGTILAGAEHDVRAERVGAGVDLLRRPGGLRVGMNADPREVVTEALLHEGAGERCERGAGHAQHGLSVRDPLAGGRRQAGASLGLAAGLARFRPSRAAAASAFALQQPDRRASRED